MRAHLIRRTGASGSVAAIVGGLSGALALLLTPTVQAQSFGSQELRPANSRGYVGLSFGRSKFDPDCVPGTSCDSGKTGFKLFAGSIREEAWGAEFAYINPGKINVSGGSQKAHGFNLSLVGTVPLAVGFSGFGKIGGTYGWTSTRSNLATVSTGDSKGLGLSYGLGLGYRLNDQLELIAEYERHRFDFTSGAQSVGLMSIGLRMQY